jgi:hypothetical protein
MTYFCCKKLQANKTKQGDATAASAAGDVFRGTLDEAGSVPEEMA